MSMSAGSSSRLSNEINVTPLIDVLLVLLIIFMVIVPVTPKGLAALTPQPPSHITAPPPDTTIVVQIVSHPGGGPARYKINGVDFAKAQLTPELARIFATRQEKVMFVKGDKDLDFGSIAEVIGFGHAASVTSIGILTPQVEAGA